MEAQNQNLFAKLLAERYSGVKSRFPGEGRRKTILRVTQEFWNVAANSKPALLGDAPSNSSAADFLTDNDPFDEISRYSSEIGVLLRTDFSDEDAWQIFLNRLQDAEKEFASESSEEDKIEEGEGVEEMELDEEDDEEDDELASIFKIVNPNSPQERTLITNISNLAALRLLNEVSIRKAPDPPAGTKRINPPNRLVDHDGWQEIYIGKDVWIYDMRSNTDQCVRVVSQTGDIYGTATGDSWRARVSHICELQVNLYSGVMKIDFGGLDRWDYSERQRNLQEAAL